MSYIAVLPGDGIGPEVINEAIKIIKSIEDVTGNKFDLEYGIVGGEAIDKFGTPLTEDTIKLIEENAIGKGDVLSVAKVAGIMASKKTSDLIPLCHPIPVNQVSVNLSINKNQNAIHVVSEVSTNGKTGIEMEALMAVSVSCLTIYDMCKSAERTIKINNIRLLQKTGGKHTYSV